MVIKADFVIISNNPGMAVEDRPMAVSYKVRYVIDLSVAVLATLIKVFYNHVLALEIFYIRFE